MRRFPVRTKHGNKKLIVDGEKFDSKREYLRYCGLKLEETGGLIKNLKRQVVYVLAPSVILDGRKKPELRYIADFTYTRNDQKLPVHVVEDAKSPHLRKNPVYRIKRHLMRTIHGIEIVET